MDFNNLPTFIPIVSVYGAVVFSDTVLPLPMSVEQYESLKEVADKNDGIVGVVQPLRTQSQQIKLPLFQSGTAVDVSGATELDDGSVIVHLKGICRFVIEEEIADFSLCRYARVSYNKYIYADSTQRDLNAFDKDAFISLTKDYMTQHGVKPNWSDLIQISPLELINFITMIGPLDPREKQAVLEIIHPSDQHKMLEKIMKMSLSEGGFPSTLVH